MSLATPAVNAASPIPVQGPAERKARRLAVLCRLSELGMTLAEAAASKAAQDLTETDTPNSPEQPAKRRTDYVLVFTRLANVVRQAIALEDRIDRAAPSPPGRASRPPPPPDRRRPMLRDALHKAAAAEPDRAARTALCRHIDERIEAELLADPAHAVHVSDILIAICEDLNLHPDVSKLPDELIGMDPVVHPDDPRPTQKLNL